jgi:RNA polymerase sigma factor (sigma-70 family)
VSADAVQPVEAAREDRVQRLARCLERARGGDPHALDEAVREMNPVLWHVARAAGLDTEDAVDVVQTAWLHLLRHLHEIRSPQALVAWLISTTRREAWRVRARLRRRSADDADLLESMPDPVPDPAEQAVLHERQRILMRHFRRLSQRCQALLRVVAFINRPDYSVLAESMGMPPGSIGPTRGRCLTKLREMLLADPTWGAR